MFTFLFPDIQTKEQLMASMDEFTLYGGWTCALAVPMAYATLPNQTAYDLVTFLTTFYLVFSWIYVLRILCK